MNTKNNINLEKLKTHIFSNIEPLLDSFNLDYRKSSDNIFMKCPIHESSDNPTAISISLKYKKWNCWTRNCHNEYGSSIFGFVQGALHSNLFSDALKYICKVYSIKGERLNDFSIGINNSASHIHDLSNNNSLNFNEIVKIITNTYAHGLSAKRKIYESYGSSSQKNAGYIHGNRHFEVSKYFLSRGFQQATLNHFGVYDEINKDSPLRMRAIVPIIYNNIEVGYIARAIKEWILPKYLISPGLKKSDYLYNYDEAVKKASNLKCFFLVEGQGDVWRLWESGVTNAVGLFGKEISSNQKGLLLDAGVSSLVVLIDNDQPGREAKVKLKRDLGRLFKLIFPNMPSKDVGSMQVSTIQNKILNTLKGLY